MPPEDIAPPMSNNEALRRLMTKIDTLTNVLIAGLQIPSQMGDTLAVHRVNAASPAVKLVEANASRKGGIVRNLDGNLTAWYGSDNSVNAQTGITLQPGIGIPVGTTGEIWVFCPNGAPAVEFDELI